MGADLVLALRIQKVRPSGSISILLRVPCNLKTMAIQEDLLQAFFGGNYRVNLHVLSEERPPVNLREWHSLCLFA